MAERTVTIASTSGLHARPPAAIFAQAATEQPAEVMIEKAGSDPVLAKSILMLLTLGADHATRSSCEPRETAPRSRWPLWPPCSSATSTRSTEHPGGTQEHQDHQDHQEH